MLCSPAVVSVTVRALMKTCSADGCGVFGSGGLIIYEISEGQDNYEIYELIPVLLLGVIGGLLGSSFIAINAKLTVWRKENVSKLGARAKIAEALLVSILTSAVSFLLPLIFSCQQCPTPEGVDCPRQQHLHSGNFVAFNCEGSNQYSDLATLFFNTQDDAIRNLFSSKTKREYTVSSLVVFVSAFYFLAIITYGISCPTGLFVPSILCGAAYGRLWVIWNGDLVVTTKVHAAADEACALQLSVGDGTGVKPIYEVQMQNKGLPFLAPSADTLLQHITAKECCGRPPVTFQRVEKVQRVLEVLSSCSHNGFPVINQTGEGRSGRSIMGMVLRQHLLKLLSTKRCFQASPFVTEVSSKVAASYTTADFCKPISASGLSPADIQLDEDQLGMYMDLGPYANPSYYVVQEDMSLSKVYTLFRTLALRHVCVIPRAHDVVGIISRKDLLPETIDAQFSQNRGQYTPDGTLSTPEDALPLRSTVASPAPVLRTGGLGTSGIGAAMSGGAEVAQAGTGDREVALTVEGVVGRRTHRQP
ncbi:putative chloride channel protein CLC-d [Dunaliella salina]|uniref:Chloride channel protein CLC-d n=1 Tax=Dunaliella salina TaxID=3046 RepID=A0ABQ7G428_DUNSA|nr:putative chloride channel protein CLC-d [Dunaliella salina]|eukprot:KAF5829363.1 putative chloride channel protein CLC-d [Dunaliella salina]